MDTIFNIIASPAGFYHMPDQFKQNGSKNCGIYQHKNTTNSVI